MTQPTVHFDESFPPPQKSETQELIEAIRDLAAAIRGDRRQRDGAVVVEEWYKLRDREEEVLGLSYSDFILPEPESDPIKSPDHYKLAGRECIEFTKDLDFVWGNIVKYLWRAPHKGDPVRDCEKALEYLDHAEDRKRPNGERDSDNEAFDFFFERSAEAPPSSVEKVRLNALTAVFNPWVSVPALRERIEGVRDRYIASED